MSFSMEASIPRFPSNRDSYPIRDEDLEGSGKA
jgi:hypothetical protein